jgi:hypothetical protein
MDLRLTACVLNEARKREVLVKALAKLKKSKKWVKEGWTRDALVSEIDPSFIHHSEHYERLIHGGTRPDGSKYPGGGGMRWGGMVISEQAALLRVLGSHEWQKSKGQEQYQTEFKFNNFQLVAEAEGLTWPEKARLLLTKCGLHVNCQCESFRFFHRYAATVKGFALLPETTSAPINNPENKSGICKHLDLVLRNLGAQAPQMASEMKTWYESKDKKKKKS